MEKIKKVYVAGPMTGLPDDNLPAFEYAAKRLRDAGFTVVSPPELEGNGNRERFAGMTGEQVYREVLPGDIAELAQCDAICVLPGFEASNGTDLELHAATLFGIEIIQPPFESGMIGLEQWVDEIINIINQINEAQLNVNLLTQKA